jgi:hypothetical protein
MSSLNGSKKISMSMSVYLEPDMSVVNKRYFHLWQNHGGIEYANNNWSRTVWVPHLSKWIHSNRAKFKPDISWIITEVLLMSKIKMFPLPTICRVSNLSICLMIHMPKQQYSIPWVGEHTL